jgi:hypothetical protein
VAAAISCDDSQPCTTDSCDSKTGCAHSSLAVGDACDDGDLCTTGETCQNGGAALVCKGSTPVDCSDSNVCTPDLCSQSLGCLVKDATCNDYNPCTTDACTAKGCTHTLGTCTAKSLSYMSAVDCGDKAWILSAPLKGISGANSSVGWAADGTPGSPGFASAPCSLNFNDGTGYTGHNWGTATNIYAFNPGDKAKVITLSFNSYDDVRADNSLDKRYVEVSNDNFNTVTVSKQIDNTGKKKAWSYTTVDLSGVAPKPFQLRFRFDSVTRNTDATLKGWFVDDINLSSQ